MFSYKSNGVIGGGGGIIGGTIMESNSNNAASYALINRIKTFDSQNNNNIKNNTSKRSNTSFNANNQKLNLSNSSVTNNNNAFAILNNSQHHHHNHNHQSSPVIRAQTSTSQSINNNNFSTLNFYNQSSHLNASFNNQITSSSSNNFNDISNGMLIASGPNPSSPTYQIDNISNNRKSSSSTTKQQQQRNSLKSSQEDLNNSSSTPYRYRVKTSDTYVNPNAYHDKITDQKFFNRNFKLKQSENTTYNNNTATTGVTSSANSNNSMNTVDLIERNYTSLGQTTNYDMIGNGNEYPAQYRMINGYHERERSSDSKSYQSNIILNNNNNPLSQSTNMNHASSNTTNLNGINASSTTTTANGINNPINKLKLLKKRNALKKTLSNAQAVQTSTQHIQANSPSNRSQNFDNLGNSSSKEDFRSQTSLNNTNINSNVISNLASSGNGNRPMSMHLSRNSLNNIDTSIPLGSNQQMHKSSETIDEIILRDAKNGNNLHNNNSKDNGFNRVRSVSRLNMVSNMEPPARTKSENELSRKPMNTNTNFLSNKLRNGRNEFDHNNNNDENNFDYDTINNTNANANKFSTTVNRTLAANSNYLNNRVKSSVTPVTRKENTSPVHNHRSSTRLDNSNNNGINNSITNNTTRTSKTNGLINRNTSLVIKNSLTLNNTTNNGANNKARLSKDNKMVTYQTSYEDNGNYEYEDEQQQQIHTDFRIVYPGSAPEIIKFNHNTVNPGDVGYLEMFEPNPYNIMSDPIISEQFRKLYEEDEYFQQVHKKCCEWLNKYVFPEMERERMQQNDLSFPQRR